MPLTLKIIAPSKLISGQVTEYRFDNLGGSIGRKPNNDFILLDPERYISSKHAIIEYNYDKYYITDTSTNGIYINNSKTPMGSGHSEELKNGDKISIGDFQLLVTLNQTAKTDPLDQLIGDPQSIPTELPTPGASYDPPSIDESFYDAPAATDTPSFAPSSLDTPSFDKNIVDPLAILDGGVENNQSSIDVNDLGINDSSVDSSYPSVTPDAFISDSFSESSILDPHQNIPEPAVINEPFTPPNAIPDDWDIMGDAKVSDNSSGRQATPSSPPVQSTSPASTASSFDPNDIFSVLEDGNSAPMAASTPQQPPNIQTDNSFIDSFLLGAGVNAKQLSVQDKHALMQKMGRLMRSSVEGLMIALRARSTIKSTFRVNKTSISPVENNPLKFLVTADDVLIALLSDDKAGYMSADEAFKEGFKDLQTHQMALMAGMQATINAIVKQFDPTNLERSFEPQAGSGLIPGQKKSKNWDCYVQFHSKLSDNLLDDFQNVYGEEFAQAYEIQINKLL